jgi:hypothetical protein
MKFEQIVTASLFMRILHAGIVDFSKPEAKGPAQILFLHLIPVTSHEHHRGPTGS